MSDYFNKIPNFEYVSRLPGAKIGDYVTVKNLFKKGALEADIVNDLAFHTKYKIKGDDRPDNVAFDVYGNSNLDWLVLTCNNIINIQTEWPLLQNDFDRFLLDKYGSYEALNDTHHYETQEIKNSKDVIIVPKGLQCASDYTVTYYDYNVDKEVIVLSRDCTTAVTNYEYESEIEDNKRNIFLLKPRYLNVIRNDLDASMPYKKGSTQYVSETLKRADNIRLYQ
tara:strand:+ start:461 stop:1132 length:672 start_codon:yes stop_codon:yes gene_type:complete